MAAACAYFNAIPLITSPGAGYFVSNDDHGLFFPLVLYQF
jgi:hypothetical protein